MRSGYGVLGILVCFLGFALCAAVAQQSQSTAAPQPAASAQPVPSQQGSVGNSDPAGATPGSGGPTSQPAASEKPVDSPKPPQKPEDAKPQASPGNDKQPVQGTFDEVHVKPIKPEEKPQDKTAANAPADSITGINAVPSASAVKSSMRTMRVDVNLVLVNVTITDPMNRLVTGLEKDNFQVFDNGEKQSIRHFSSEDAPISLGVIFDMSGSMNDKIERAKEAVVEFFKTANPEDEFFLIAFNDKPDIVTDFTNSVEQVQADLIYTLPKGRTALMDAIYVGLTKMRQARNQKKALLIISDGGDNHSRYTENEIKSLVREADVQVYAIGIFSANANTPEEVAGPVTLSDITDVTGGRTFTIDNPNELSDVATKIGVELRNQYVLGYRPTKPVHDGKWRKIKVKLSPPKGLPPLTVFSKTGYYAPTD